jgi:membrane-associated phospholipid phosphatase
LALLSWWYPDTYELNRMLPNLDHHFAALEQTLFGCQPALTFAQQWDHPVWSELMHLGYASYYPMIGVVTLYYFFRCYQDFNRASFVILASFFIYYVIFIALPVTGPQYYYLAAGTDNIAQGIFPDVGSYFNQHQEALHMPGWEDGFFYHLVAGAHQAGERPTAAFPSSHVGVTTILMLLSWYSRSRRLFYSLLPLFLLMCLATVYIQAHYVIDVIAGWITGLLFFLVLWYGYGKRG